MACALDAKNIYVELHCTSTACLPKVPRVMLLRFIDILVALLQQKILVRVIISVGHLAKMKLQDRIL